MHNPSVCIALHGVRLLKNIAVGDGVQQSKKRTQMNTDEHRFFSN